MSDRYQLEAEINFIAENLDPPSQALLALKLTLVRKDRRAELDRLATLMWNWQDHETECDTPTDDELDRLFRCLPEDEAEAWFWPMWRLAQDDDAGRFAGFVEILRARVAS